LPGHPVPEGPVTELRRVVVVDGPDGGHLRRGKLGQDDPAACMGRPRDLDERLRGEGTLVGAAVPENTLAPRARSVQATAELEEELGPVGGGGETIANARDPLGWLEPDSHRRVDRVEVGVRETGTERDQLRGLTDDGSLEAFPGGGQHAPLGELAGQRLTDLVELEPEPPQRED